MTTAPASASSIAASVAASSSIPDAAAFCLDLLRTRGSDDCGRDIRFAEHPGERELHERDPEPVGDRPQPPDALEDAVG